MGPGSDGTRFLSRQGGNEGSSFTNRGSWNRGVGSHHGTWGLRRWMIGCSTIAFTPTPMWQVLLLGSQPGEMRGPFVRTWVQNFSVTLKNHVGALLHGSNLTQFYLPLICGCSTNARLHSLNTKSALPTSVGTVLRSSGKAGCRAGFTIPVRNGQSRPVTEHRPPAWGQHGVLYKNQTLMTEFGFRSCWGRDLAQGACGSARLPL